MISVNDFKTGLTISVDNGIWKVIDFQHVKPGKGSAFVRSKLRNLRTGAIQENIPSRRESWTGDDWKPSHAIFICWWR